MKIKKRRRRESRLTPGDLTIRIDSSFVWSDLALPMRQVLLLNNVATHFQKKTSGHRQQKLAPRSTAVFGPGALFLGKGCTGKTKAAGVLTTELHADVYRIDLSQLVCRYVAETERKLGHVFNAVENSDAILFFDEADALFGKRGEVKDSHNSYANIEINNLLERIEGYPGLVILATTSNDELFKVFLRRFRHIVSFLPPDAVPSCPHSSGNPILIFCKGHKKQYSVQSDENGRATIRFEDSPHGQTPGNGSETYAAFRNSKRQDRRHRRCTQSSARHKKRSS